MPFFIVLVLLFCLPSLDWKPVKAAVLRLLRAQSTRWLPVCSHLLVRSAVREPVCTLRQQPRSLWGEGCWVSLGVSCLRCRRRLGPARSQGTCLPGSLLGPGRVGGVAKRGSRPGGGLGTPVCPEWGVQHNCRTCPGYLSLQNCIPPPPMPTSHTSLTWVSNDSVAEWVGGFRTSELSPAVDGAGL